MIEEKEGERKETVGKQKRGEGRKIRGTMADKD